MPYINTARRAEINDFVDKGAEDLFDVGYYQLDTPGELNWALTMLIRGYLEAEGRTLNYQLLNDIMGALGAAKAEFYRRVVEPYEDRKIRQNGDVYQ